MDFAMESLNKHRIQYIEDKVNEAIEADYPIRVYTLPQEEDPCHPRLGAHQNQLAASEYGRGPYCRDCWA